MPSPRFALCALALAIAAPSLAQTTYAFSGDPFSATPADLRAASTAQPVDHAFRAQILFEEGVYTIAADASLSYRHRLVYRVDSPEGVEGWSEISAHWDPWFEQPAQLHARVLQPNGQFVSLDQRTVTDAPIKADDSQTFSSEHVRRAPLPGVTVGAIVEEEEITNEKAAYFKDGSLYSWSFRENVPMGRVRLVVDTPGALPFKDEISQPPATLNIDRTTNPAGRRHIVYEATSLPARHDSDIDLSTNNPGGPHVEFATGTSWESVAASYSKMVEAQTAGDGARAMLPADLPPDTPSTRLARITAIVQKLHRDVRYTGVEFGSAKLTPVFPAEVMQRHYGDCKDKATLLVAMLRAAGIPAHLALLDTGPGRDVTQQLAGMNRFDHAIVYVPAAGQQPALWIDATAQFNEVGTIPAPDHGRMALIIAPETRALQQIPVAVPSDSIVQETRTFTLPSFGPSRVSEISATHGFIDANYRASYGTPDNTKTREEMERYIQRAYLAKKLASLEHGDGSDLQHPFTLTLEADSARRGVIALTDGVVVVFPNGAMNSLPRWFNETPPVIGPDSSPEARAEAANQISSRFPTYTFNPFIHDQTTRVLIPAGFVLRSLPADKVTPIGTGKLTETYTQSPAGQSPAVVTARFVFDSGPANFTADQALSMRDAVLELDKREFVGLYLDQLGAKELAAGHIRQALEADRSLIASHPDDALARARLARALLEAGIGDAAQAEARKAVALDPKSAPAFTTLGWTLEHDGLGVRWGKGFDRTGALAAYQRAAELDPDSDDGPYSRAILLEFDAQGTRYAPNASMPEAIKTYEALIAKSKDKDANQANQYRENMLFTMLFAGHFKDVDALLATLPASNTHSSMAITSATAQHGAPAGIALADKGNISTVDRNKNLRTAGTQLARLHLYAQAADILTAGMQGGEDAPTVARQIELYRSLKPTSLAPLPDSNPAQPVWTILSGTLAGTLTREQAQGALSKQAYSTPQAMERDVKKNLQGAGFLRKAAEKSDMTESVLLDLIAGSVRFTSTGDDLNGFSIIEETLGSEPSRFFVVKEDGRYKVVADEHDSVQVGTAVLSSLAHGKPGQARAILDWERDFTHKGGTDDPFAGPLLPVFWTVGSSKPDADSPEAMRLAGISLLAGSMSAKPFLTEIAAAREKATGQRQTDLDRLLAEAAIGAEDPALAHLAANHLLEQEPDSLTALRIAGAAFSYEGNSKGWLDLLAPRLAKKPKDHDLLAEQARAFSLAHDFDTAQSTEQKVLDSGKANSSDYNSFAWLGLFRTGTSGLGPDAIKAAQQSNMLSKNGSFADLHTLACVYAAEGKTTEARQVLAQAMYAGNQSEPNSAVWYALGLLYEQYGEKEAARAAYRKVDEHENDDHTYIDPVATSNLAHTRLTALGS